MRTDNKGNSKKLNTRKRNTTVERKPSTNDANELKKLNAAFEAPTEKKTNKKVPATKKEKPVKEKKPRKLNAFMLFAKEKRESVKKNHPTAKVTEIAKKLGELWRALSNSEKQKYKQ